MSNKWVWRWIALILLLLIGWGIEWFFNNFEQRTRAVVEGMSPQAKRNPLLAAERFLNRVNVAAESVSGRDQLLNPPAEPGLLLVYRWGVSLPAEREQALIDWIRQGGQLLITPGNAWDEAAETSGNSLLDRLGVQPVFSDAEADPAAVQGLEQRPGSVEQPAPVVFAVPGSGEPVRAAFSRRQRLFDSQGRADWTVEAAAGAHLLRYHLGQGSITVIADLEIFSNSRIGEADHALLLALLVGDARRAWLLYSSAMPSLPQLLWHHAPGLVISLLTLGLLLVWSLTLRSGPVSRAGAPVRRNLMEHLAAAGRYLWRTDQAAGVFGQSRAALEQAWRRRHPVLGTLDQAARCEWISLHTGLSVQAVERALQGEYQGEQAFIQMTAVQQKLMAQLRIQKGPNSTGEKGSE